jgi:hypothetical protein
MPFRIQCSSGHILVIPERWAGAKFHCPKCGAAVLVPGIGQDEAIVLDGEIDSMILSTVPASSLPAESFAPAIPSSPVLATVAETSTSRTETSVTETTSPLPEASSAMDQPAKTPAKTLVQPSPSPLPQITASPVQETAAKPTARRTVDPQQATAFHLGLLVMAVALFSVVPAVWEWLAIWQQAASSAIPPWVYVSLLAGAVLFAYGIYVAQLPDWSSLWVATAALLLTAACYAALLASTWLGTDESSLVTLLRYGDKLAGQRAVMWCFVMLSLSSVAAYFLGHSAVQWYNAYRLIKQMRQQRV